VLSLTVTVSRGPGIKAPERAMTKEEVKIAVRLRIILDILIFN
jgi:hypothetical protein